MDLPLCSFISCNIHLKSGYLHTVESKMFNTSNNVFFLNTTYQSTPHLSDMKRVFSKNLLAPSPTGVIGNIYTDSSKKVAPMGPYLLSNNTADPCLQFDIKGGTTGHRCRETGAVTHHNPP